MVEGGGVRPRVPLYPRIITYKRNQDSSSLYFKCVDKSVVERHVMSPYGLRIDVLVVWVRFCARV